MSDLNSFFLPFGWTDSAQAPALSASPSTLWDVVDKGIAGYLTIQSQKSTADAQARLIEAQTKQALLLGTVPRGYNADAQLTPLSSWSNWQGGGGAPMGGGGADIGSLLLIAGLVLGAVYLVR